MPFYELIKLGLILWLISPWTRGAYLVYRLVVRPLLRKYGGKIDMVYEEIADSARQAGAVVYSATTAQTMSHNQL